MRICIVLLFISLQYSLLEANLSELTYVGEGYIFAYPKECNDIKQSFAEYASNFTLCSVQYARPIRLCEECVDHYVKFRDKYQELLNTVVNGTSCKTIFISHDRLDVLVEYHDSILSIWNKGHCNACYDWSNGSPSVSNNTITFNKKYADTMDCITSNLSPSANNSEEVCEKCMQSYIRLDEYYKTLSTDSIGVDSICMDIVDSMNATRSIWSKTLNCCKLRRSPEIIFLCCTGIISLLPLLYYLAVRYCGPIRDLPNVLKQSRFKQTILRSVNGRIN